mmetsp:Transcript_52422/g.52797  ORF Transcript_52422/g.52797 Transcript_52422/m.52797 type:complete len:81 (-) Transcript_52422:306-548(-)
MDALFDGFGVTKGVGDFGGCVWRRYIFVRFDAGDYGGCVNPTNIGDGLAIVSAGGTAVPKERKKDRMKRIGTTFPSRWVV